jgi:hypothetical protein
MIKDLIFLFNPLTQQASTGKLLYRDAQWGGFLNQFQWIPDNECRG